MKAIAVIRVSSVAQGGEMINGEREGLERQRISVRQIAANVGAELIDVVEIIGVSGNAVADCPEWTQRVLPRLDGKVVLVVNDVDRLIRADNFDLRTLGQIQATGTPVYTPNGRHDFDRPEDVMLATVLAAVGGVEKAKIRARSMAGRRAKRDAGLWVDGQTGYGLKWDKKARQWILTDKADKLREAFARVAAGEDCTSVGKFLGVTRAGVKVIMKNPIYLGRKGPTGGADLAPLVDTATWATVQQRFNATETRYATSRADTMALSVYSGLLTVDQAAVATGWFTPTLTAELPHTIYYVNGGGVDRKHAYRCRCGQDRTGAMTKCKTPQMHAATSNATIDAFLSAMTKDPDFVRLATEALVSKGTAGLVDRKTALEAKAEAARATARRAAKWYTDGRLEEADAIIVQDKARATVKACEAELALIAQSETKVTPLDVAQVFTTPFDPLWGEADKRAWAKRHLATIYIRPSANRGKWNSATLEVTMASVRVPLAAGGHAVFNYAGADSSTVGVMRAA